MKQSAGAIAGLVQGPTSMSIENDTTIKFVDDSSAEDDEADHAAVERLGGGAALILDPRMLQGLIGSQA